MANSTPAGTAQIVDLSSSHAVLVACKPTPMFLLLDLTVNYENTSQKQEQEAIRVAKSCFTSKELPSLSDSALFFFDCQNAALRKKAGVHLCMPSSWRMQRWKRLLRQWTWEWLEWLERWQSSFGPSLECDPWCFAVS